MRLQNKRVAVFLGPEFEDLEFWVPVMRLREEGAQVVVASSHPDETLHGKGGLAAQAECTFTDLDPATLDGVVVPGGWAPDKLRRDAAVLALVRQMDQQGKIIAMICHGGLVGISAGIVRGRLATGSLGIKDDLVNAGAIWQDQPAFRAGNLVWGRVVPDIPAFCRELVAALSESAPG